jgi:hypothetical protein
VGLQVGTSNLGLDSDGDGLADLDEYRLGTHPNDPTSFFNVVARGEIPARENWNNAWYVLNGL